MVTGRTRYGIDVRLPGLRTAVVAHCPMLGGELRRFDATEALARPGVEAVFAIPGGVAVVADGYWRARQALRRVSIEWSQEPARLSDSAAIRAQLARRLDRGHGRGARDEGDVEAAFEAALAEDEGEATPRMVEAEYALPLLAHATMEPMNCTVVPGEGRCDVYVGSQAPDAVQDVVAERLDLDRDAVRVHTTAIGGGFGRRLLPDVAAEAAEIARRFEGPVKLVWSREDDMARDAYRPPSLHRLRGLLDEQGALAAWEHCMALPSLLPDLGPDAVRPMAPQWLRPLVQRLARGATWATPRLFGPVLGVEGAAELPYAVPHLRVTGAAQGIGVPVGMWRSVGHSHNAFVVESFVDELAHAAGSDPADFRRAHLEGHPRHRAVLDALVEAAQWGSPSAAGARGLALHESYGTVVGQVAEVSVTDDGAIRVHRVVCVVDCGRAVNPDVVRAQMEGGIVFGLSAALHGRVTVEGGRVQQSNFHDYPLLRMAQAPSIAVHLMPSSEPPTGVGEPGTPPIAAAVGNAVFAATGVRLRTLPFDLGAARSGAAPRTVG